MFELKDKIDEVLDGVLVDNIELVERDNHKYLEIALKNTDDTPLSVDEIEVMAKKINPIVDEADIVDGQYILDIYGKVYENE